MENNMENVNENVTLEECLKREIFANPNDVRVLLMERDENIDLSIIKGSTFLYTSDTELAKEKDGTCCLNLSTSIRIDKKYLKKLLEQYEQQQFNELYEKQNKITSKIDKLRNVLNN